MAEQQVRPAVVPEAAGEAQPGSDGAATPPRKNKMWSVCIFILVVEMCERLCYYTLQGSQRNFLEAAGPADINGKRGLSAAGAVSISSCFSMLSYLTCVMGGYIADSRIGRYKTILCFAQVYVLGVVMVAASAFPAIMDSKLCLPLYLVGALVFVAIGTGAIKPNVMNFGADQYDPSDPVELAQQKTFFSYFYLTINVGVIGAFGFCCNLATAGSTQADPGSGFFESYVIAAVAMALATITYISGTPRYTGRGGPAERTPTVSVVRKHIMAAASTSCKAKMAILGWTIMPLGMILVLVASLMSGEVQISRIMSWTSMGLTCVACFFLSAAHLRNSYIQPVESDAAPAIGGITVADVRGALACVPTIVCVNVGFGIPYNAMNNAYPIQACQMDTRIFGQQLNGAFFNLGDAFAIIIFVPVFEYYIFPFITRKCGAPTRRAKYTCGFAFAILANLAAALIEHIRRDKSLQGDFVQCPVELLGSKSCEGNYYLSECSPNSSLPMTAMSSFWTFFPMALTGLGEILVNPVIYQYVFEEAPSRLRSLVQALNLVANGAVANAITAALSPLVPEDLNKGHIVYYFYTNVVLAAVLLVAYWVVARYSDSQGESPEPEPAGIVASMLASEMRGASLLTASSGIPGSTGRVPRTSGGHFGSGLGASPRSRTPQTAAQGLLANIPQDTPTRPL